MADDLIMALEGRIEFLGQALQTVVRDYAPNHLKGYIFVRASVAPTRATLSLRVQNDNPQQKYGSADAAAQEFGMGGKSVSSIPPEWKDGVGHILPINGVYLVFMGTHDYEGQLIFTPMVTKHPGSPPYEERGYIKPAIEEFKGTVLPSLDPDIRDFVSLAVRKSFPGAGKK